MDPDFIQQMKKNNVQQRLQSLEVQSLKLTEQQNQMNAIHKDFEMKTNETLAKLQALKADKVELANTLMNLNQKYDQQQAQLKVLQAEVAHLKVGLNERPTLD